MFVTTLPLAALLSTASLLSCEAELHVGPATLEAGTGVLEVAVEVPWPVGGGAPEGQSIALTVTRPAGVESLERPVRNGLGVFEVPVGPRAGVLSVSVRTCPQRSGQESVLILSSEPAAFSISIEAGPEPYTPAIRIGPVTDRFGNVLEDGTEVRILLSAAGQPVASRTTSLIGGQAHESLPLSPATPQPDRVDVIIRGRVETAGLAPIGADFK